MEIRLDPQYGFVEIDGKFNQKEALINTGVKAAVCYKQKGATSPWGIRVEEDNKTLIKRGINTILSDHTTPSELEIALEIIDIPKILCMVLNNEHQYSADERSLRYTPIETAVNINDIEKLKYEKWLNIFQKILIEEYWDFFIKYNVSEKAAKTSIKKIAQENARYMVTVFMPTTLTYRVPWAQINKIVLYMERFIADPNKTELQEMLIPYMKDFINQLKKLKVIITKEDAIKICNELDIENLKFPQNNNYLYSNNKQIELSLFADKNKFSGIYQSNEFGTNFSYNFYPSFASFAQIHRHRSVDCEFIEDDNLEPYLPPLIEGKSDLEKTWFKDMAEVRRFYPQGQKVRANISGSQKNLLNFVGKERSCDLAQLETQHFFTHELIPADYAYLLKTGQEEMAYQIEPYVLKLRCKYPDYNCPLQCGHPRLKRKF